LSVERLFCECGWELTPQFDGDIGWLFHGLAGHKVHVSCGRKIGPYDCCTVVEGDCRQLLEHIASDRVELLLTDPPYGIAAPTDYAKAKRGGRDYAPIFGDDKPFDPAHLLRFPRSVIFGANHFASRLPDSAAWFVWWKRWGNHDHNDQADCELAWTNLPGPARLFHHPWNGATRASERGIEREHPTQKPLELMRWLIQQHSERGGRDPRPLRRLGHDARRRQRIRPALPGIRDLAGILRCRAAPRGAGRAAAATVRAGGHRTITHGGFE